MWETAFAFAIWGAYGSVLTAAHINPVITALSRSVGLGLMLSICVRSRIPWRSAALWSSGLVLLIDEVLYSVSAVSGPVAIIGLAYGCVPVVVPLVSQLIGTDAAPLARRRWIYLALAFIGNLLIFSALHAARIAFTRSAVFAFFAALLFCVLPIASASLQQAGLSAWGVLKGQGVVATVFAFPLLAGLWMAGCVGATDAATVRKSLAVGGLNSVVFTVVPFYFWYRGIGRAGVSRTSVCCFAEPLVAAICSLLVLKDAPATPGLLAGVALVLGGIILSTRA